PGPALTTRYDLRKDSAPCARRRLSGGDRLRVAAPQPSQRVGQDRRTVAVAVAVFPQFELHVVAGKLERGSHPGVLEVPAAGIVDQILTARLHEDAQRSRLGPANQARQPIGAPEI